jgi:hypothetical protein
MHVLKYKLLNIPILVWGLQLLYVAIALTLLFFLTKHLNKELSRWLFIALYIIAMIIIDVIWRVSIKKLIPGWY